MKHLTVSGDIEHNYITVPVDSDSIIATQTLSAADVVHGAIVCLHVTLGDYVVDQVFKVEHDTFVKQNMLTAAQVMYFLNDPTIWMHKPMHVELPNNEDLRGKPYVPRYIGEQRYIGGLHWVVVNYNGHLMWTLYIAP